VANVEFKKAQVEAPLDNNEPANPFVNPNPFPGPNQNGDPLPIQKPPIPAVDPNPGRPLPDRLPADLSKKVEKATAYLRVTMPSGQVSEGSGFLVVEPGIVVTNAHVLGMLQATSQPPRQVEVTLHSG